MIEMFASAYEHPEEVRAWYRSNKDRLAEIEALVMEELVGDQIVLTATVKSKPLPYDLVMNPPKEEETEKKT